MDKSVIIVAGGLGKRMQADIPKQFMIVGGKPVIIHAISKFQEVFPGIETVVVLPADHLIEGQNLFTHNGFHNITTVQGGNTRFHSVKAGLRVVKGNGLIAVHDAVRPLVSLETILAAFNSAEKSGSGVPCIAVQDSLRTVVNEENRAVDRNKFVAVQTPQCFQAEILRTAYEQEYIKVFTDDASVVEQAGYSITLTKGNRENIKLTTATDVKVAAALFDT